jgi:hypothetical protein
MACGVPGMEKLDQKFVRPKRSSSLNYCAQKIQILGFKNYRYQEDEETKNIYKVGALSLETFLGWANLIF